jgi:hypothetical protein
MTTQTNIAYGIAVNRLRKLKAAWAYWFPLRQYDPLRGRNAEQEMAEVECARLAPMILEAKAVIAKEIA